MNRAPAVGDIISIRRVELVVVDAGAYAAHPTIYSFGTIKRDDLGKVNPKMTNWQLIGGLDLFPAVSLADITFHEQIKLKTKVETTYTAK